jgi:hypothetical protein
LSGAAQIPASTAWAQLLLQTYPESRRNGSANQRAAKTERAQLPALPHRGPATIDLVTGHTSKRSTTAIPACNEQLAQLDPGRLVPELPSCDESLQPTLEDARTNQHHCSNCLCGDLVRTYGTRSTPFSTKDHEGVAHGR